MNPRPELLKQLWENKMSNAKLKEQIEAAKIALVHSAEQSKNFDSPSNHSAAQKINDISKNSTFDDLAINEDDAKVATLNPQQSVRQGLMPDSDFEILENRLYDLEAQIKNQQRDLHTLLQKLRDITARSNPKTETKKNTHIIKWTIGLLLIVSSLSIAYLTLGVDTLMHASYLVIGEVVALIDILLHQE